MMKFILKAYSIWELGKRANQEDSLFPAFGYTKDTDRLFILCDGMGGHHAGEVASRIVCDTMSKSVLSNIHDQEGLFTDEDFNHAFSAALKGLDECQDEGEQKMGTTMTFLKFHSQGCTIAHIGDSRVYHIRPGKDEKDTRILFQTIDHSLVNDLVRLGELTPEEACHFNKRNVITRAMQPHMERCPKADLHHISDIRPGDYFMLCSDGILEEMEESHLRYIFSLRGGDNQNKLDMLKKVTCHNRDNHSAIIVNILEVDSAFPAPDDSSLAGLVKDRRLKTDYREVITPQRKSEYPSKKGACETNREFVEDEKSIKKTNLGIYLWYFAIAVLCLIGLGYFANS